MRQPRLFGRRTKIVATIGPASGSTEVLERLIRAGVNVARLNLAHGGEDDHAGHVAQLREIAQRLDTSVAILVDLPGDKFRTGALAGGRAILHKGASITLLNEPSVGDAARVSVSPPGVSDYARRGDTVLIGDGNIQLTVIRRGKKGVEARVVAGGVLTEGRGLVIPGRATPGPYLSETMLEKLRFAASLRPDYLALSFVTAASDMNDVRAFLRKQGADIPLIAKIERAEAVRHFQSILAVSDAVMVARGDLGVEIPLERVPLVQKQIIAQCNRVGTPVITATEMLMSMVKSTRPTRAEATDVANAIFDGTDATMLSEETAIGSHPVEAVRMMDRIARATERSLPYESALLAKNAWLELRTEELISYNACLTAHSLGAKAIVAFTESGSTAARVSKYRPRTPILAITPDATTARRLVLLWVPTRLMITPFFRLRLITSSESSR